MEELSSFPSTASTSQEGHESNSESTSSRKLKVTLLSSEWTSTKGGLSTINRELAIQLAKHPSVEVSVYLPQCSEEDKQVAARHNVQLIKAEEMQGYDPVDWLSFLPENHSVDCVIGHGAVLGRQVQGIKRQCKCKWIQVVHTAPEELGMYKSYADAISKGEKKHQDEVKLCEKADQVVAVGPKLAEAFSGYLRACGKDQDVLNLTPGIFSEFSDVKQATEERKTFSVLVFGRGDNEDFELKGYDIAALAIAQLKDEPEPYKLLFVGAPSGKEENVKDLLLEQGIDRSQLTVRCFNESREQLARLFCEVDLAIMPSRTEGFGLAALEALSAGLPVLVSGNSGLGEALQEVPFGPYCVVESEDPKDWANAIRGARKKKRKFRLDESKILCEIYAKVYNWQDHCKRLIEIMCNISRENRAANEQDSSVTATVDCHTGEKPSRSEKLPQKGPSEGLQPVKHGKRPLPPSGIPDPKHLRLSKDKENLDIQIDCNAIEHGGASSTQNVSGKENVVDRRGPSSQEVLNRIADKFIQKIDPSDEEGFNGFLQYMEKVRQTIVVDVKTGSLIITVRCTSLRILDELWKDYYTGHLQEVAQRYLMTEDILQQWGLDSVQLTLTISEEEYKAYRENFLKNEGIVEPVENTSLPDDLLSVSNLDTIKTEGEQTLPTDAAPSEFSQDLSPPCKASTSQEGQGNSSSSPSSKELRAVSLKGSKEGKRPLASSSTLASKSTKTLGDEGSAKKRQTSRKGKRPLSSSNIRVSKYRMLLKGKGLAKKRQTAKKGKRPLSSSNIPAPKYPRLLTDEDWNISVAVKILKAEYKRRSQLRPLFWNSTIELPLENVYTRLKIVSQRKAYFQVDDNEVNVFDIFTALDKGEDVMTLVEGSPGIGKTTFCLKLACDWAHGKIPSECSFPKFELMLLLKCRDIHEDIMETISEQLLPEDMEEKTKERLFDFFKDFHNQEKTLIILDGLNELPKDSERYVDQLLQRRILPFCYVLATSRQETGIDVRKKYCFDILLEIKGFTESDAFDYIRKHFENVGPLHSSMGESLVKEIKQNSLLHALRNNPLNVLLLCVIYEDYEGNLPSSHSELYQVIVLCLLRRYCTKHNLEAPKDNNALEKQFKDTILALGELAWMCLLSDRYCFRESELAVIERRYKGSVLRHVGLVYKEESLRRLKPQHEYCFLHKTFQEYLAAAFVAHKLRVNELRLFDRLSFDELVKRYREVFLFVSGILGRDAIILFSQIGEELKNWGKWDWVTCTQYEVVTMDDREKEDDWYSVVDDKDQGWAAATFLTKTFSESGHAEQMAATLCSYIPFPTHVEIELDPPPGNDDTRNIYHVLDACKTFSNLQKPVRLTLYDSYTQDLSDQTVAEYIQSCPQLESLSIFTPSMTSNLANALHNGLSGNTTLSEFTLEVCGSISCDAAAVIGEWLAGRKSLKNVTFLLRRAKSDAWASAIETGLSADTLLSSVELSVCGSLSDTSILALGKLTLNGALTRLSLNISGDMQTLIANVISRGIALQTTLKSFSLNIDGNLSSFGADSLKRGLLENCSLNNLRVSVHGKVPSNWQTFLETIRLAKKLSVTLNFYPDSCSGITHNQLDSFCPGPDVVEKGLQTKQDLTVVIWGELSCDAAEALSEVLVRASLTSLALKMHGRVTDNVAYCIERYVRRHKTLLSLTIDVWGELAPGTRTFLQGLASTDKTVEVRVHGVWVVSDESCNALDVCIDSIESLSPVLYKIKDTREEKINLKIVNDDGASKDWTHLVGDALAENTTVTALDVTINNYMTNVTADLGKELGESLSRSSSLTTLNLAINNYSKMAEGWECSLVNSLSKLASLTTLNLAIDDNGEGRTAGKKGLVDGLMEMTSLSTLSIVINDRNLYNFWSSFLRNCLGKNTSLALLCVTVNNYDDNIEYPDYSFDYPEEEPDYWYEGLADGLARTTSLKELTLTINNISLFDNCWVENVCEGFVKNESVTTLTVTVSGDPFFPECESWVPELNYGLSKNNSLTTLTLIANEYSKGERREGRDLFWADKMSSAENASLTTLNLTINICREVSEDWLPKLCDCLVNSSSLTTLRLNVNNHCATNESRIYDFSKLRLKYRSLSTFELIVTFYGE